jgi:hypothetical protein
MGTEERASGESTQTKSTARADAQASPARPSPPAFETIESAAKRLGVDATRLRERCRREGRRLGDCVVTFLGDDVVAFKFGRRWRVRFKEPPRGVRRSGT